jgi:hypothetical protein
MGNYFHIDFTLSAIRADELFVKSEVIVRQVMRKTRTDMKQEVS